MTLLTTPLVDRVAAALREAGVAPQDRVLVAVSAGADSTALACLLHEVPDLRAGLVLGHVDHGWRGPEEAEADWAFVRALAARLGVPALRSAPPPAEAPRTEDAARRHRYVELARMAREAEARCVAVGHHLADQAETLVMRVLRGSGAYGLAGIPPRRSLGGEGLRLVRPLLEIHPDELRSCLRKRSVPWREDPTNAVFTRERARVRKRLVDHAAQHGDPRAYLAALAARFRRRIAAREARIAASTSAAMRIYPWAGAVRCRRAHLRALETQIDLELAVRTLGRALHAERDGPWLTRRTLDIIRHLLKKLGAVDLPRGLRFHVSGRGAWLCRREQPELGIPIPKVDVVDLAHESFSHAATSAVLDADVLGTRPRFRFIDDADTFVPFSSTSGRAVNIVRWLSKQGVPHLARRGVLVLEGQSGVAWVVGERIDARHAIGADTRRGVRVTLRERGLG